MQVISVTFPKKIVVTVAVTAKHVVSADLTEILLDLDAINGEVIGTTAAEKTDKIEATKLAIETAVEAEGVTIPVDTVFADYPDYMALIPGVVEAAYKSSVDAVNGETSVDLTAGIALTASTKLAIETAIETANVDVPAGTVFADYPAKIGEAVTLAENEAWFSFDAATKTLYGYNSINGPKDMVIPASIDGVAVEIIGTSAFQVINSANRFTSAFIPDSVKTIQNQIFYGQALMTVLRLPINPLFTAIPPTFAWGARIIVFDVPISVLSIGTQALYGDVSLVEVKLPGVTSIGASAFYFTPLVKITIGANCTITSNAASTMGNYGVAFEALYNGNGKLAGTYEYAAGSWSKTA